MSVYNSDDFLFYYSGAERRARVAAGDPSFSRSSTAMRRDRSEIMREVDEGAYRRNWVEDENGFLVPANRLEAARTNSILHSEDFSDAAWTGTATVTTDDAVAPDGATTANKVEDDDGASIELLEQTFSGKPDDSLNRAASVFVKKQGTFSTTVELQLLFTGGTTAQYVVQLNPSTGEIDTSRKDSSTRANIEDYNSDWWRLWIVGANNSTGNTNYKTRFIPAINASGADGTTDGSATGSAHFWGAQLEGLSGGADFSSSYIATTDSAVSRAVDDLSFPIGFGPQELTKYGKVELRSIDQLVSLVHIGNETDGMRVEVGASNNLVAKLFDGGSTASSSASLGHSVGDIVEYRAVYESNGDTTIHFSLNGGSETSGSTDTSQDLPSSFGMSDAQVGAEQDGSNPATAAHISGPIIAPGVKSMNEMRNLAGTA